MECILISQINPECLFPFFSFAFSHEECRSYLSYLFIFFGQVLIVFWYHYLSQVRKWNRTDPKVIRETWRYMVRHREWGLIGRQDFLEALILLFRSMKKHGWGKHKAKRTENISQSRGGSKSKWNKVVDKNTYQGCFS